METTPKTTPQEAKAPATAAGQYLGYSLQQTLLAIRLRKAAVGSACSLEILDDVAEQAELKSQGCCCKALLNFLRATIY